jgi:hypothetical protein
MSAMRTLRTWKPTLCVVQAVVSKRGVDDGNKMWNSSLLTRRFIFYARIRKTLYNDKKVFILN